MAKTKEKAMQKQVPYDTGKVKIGLLYTPPPPTPTPEEDWVQDALLGGSHRVTDLMLTAIQSIGLIAVFILVMLLLGGN
jgi:hypothetical protein